jgi:hypothetical protein
MAGRSAQREDPAIHVLLAASKEDVDARVKLGHDERR